MAFKLAQTDTFKTEVTVLIANEKGTLDKSTFHGIFKRPTTSAYKDLIENPMPDTDVANKYLIGWEMTDFDTNEVVPYNKDNLAALLAITTAPAAIANAFIDACRGVKAKNLR